MTRVTQWCRLVVAAGIVLSLTGCADPAGTQPGSPGTSSTTPGAPSTSATQPGQITLRGVVQAGVEANCLLLAAEDGNQYLLLDGDSQVLRQGAEVEVTGVPRSDVSTTCQQGIPLTVLDARSV